MHFYRKYGGFLAIFLAGMFLAVIANNALFQHTHRTSDGRIITHAHPFPQSENSSAPGKSHSHSQNELIAIAHASDITVDQIPQEFSLFNKSFQVIFLEFQYSEPHLFYKLHYQLQNRPPPVS